MTAYWGEQWVNRLVQGLNDRFVPCQLWDLFQPHFSYWPNALTTRLPAAPKGDYFEEFDLFKTYLG